MKMPNGCDVERGEVWQFCPGGLTPSPSFKVGEFKNNEVIAEDGRIYGFLSGPPHGFDNGSCYVRLSQANEQQPQQPNKENGT